MLSGPGLRVVVETPDTLDGFCVNDKLIVIVCAPTHLRLARKLLVHIPAF